MSTEATFVAAGWSVLHAYCEQAMATPWQVVSLANLRKGHVTVWPQHSCRWSASRHIWLHYLMSGCSPDGLALSGHTGCRCVQKVQLASLPVLGKVGAAVQSEANRSSRSSQD